MNNDPHTRGRAVWRGLGPALLVGVAIVMFARTIRGWPDPIVDFGREIYVPWRLVAGDALFTDIAWFNGPLSPHWNALLFRLFGPGLSVLVAGNAVVLVSVVAVSYLLVSRVADRVAAVTGGLLILLVFAFGQSVGIANYNWITPYSHELTHGIALVLAAVFALDRGHRTGSLAATAFGGFALGLSFLTKVEPFVAGLAAAVVLLVPYLRGGRARAIGAFVGAALLPVALSVVAFGPTATLGPWPTVLDGDVSGLSFYQAGMGLDLPGLRIAEMLTWAAIWGLVLAIPMAVAWLARETRTPLAPWLAALVFALPFVYFADSIPWRDVLLPLPLVLLIAGLVQLRPWWRTGGPDRTTALALTVLGIVLLFKMILRVRASHYGFALAMPASIVLATVLVTWTPRWLSGRGLRGDVFRACALVLLGIFSLAHVEATDGWMVQKTETVSDGRDVFRSDVRGMFVNAAVDYLEASGARTAAVVPEGVMINYLARVPNPTPYLNFMPPEQLMFGDEAWAEAFRRSPPDVVLIVPKNTEEFGMGQFGSGYGTALTSWISANYRLDRTLSVEGFAYEITALVRDNGSGAAGDDATASATR